MPLLPVSELEKISPIFQNKLGNAFLASVRKLLSVSKLSDIYDELDHYRDADFATALLDRLGISREIGRADRLQNLPEGPFIIYNCEQPSLRRDRRDRSSQYYWTPEARFQGDGQ